ncbi:MAG TPA: hypothetical protein VNX18_23880 [Bryobacteraceae bacterium]|nr:hypothetical protein [Bryobacteraceae bacterium]
MFRRICLALMFTVTAFSATVRLYLKDGTYQLTREYQVQKDRVRYFSTERDDWEEIPLEMVDLERTKNEMAARESEIKAEVKAQSEEDAALREAEKQVELIPVEPGVYYIHDNKLEPIKIAESKIVNNKRRSVLKALSPIPLVPGKQTVEIDGDAAAKRIDEKRPEFFFRMSDEERLAIIRLTPKKGARVVENLEIVPVSKEVVEQPVEIATFKKMVADQLFKIWPEKDLEPGEYAVIEFTEGKVNLQTWDFGIGPVSAPSEAPKKRK